MGPPMVRPKRVELPEGLRAANAGWSFERKLDAWRAVFAAHGLVAP